MNNVISINCPSCGGSVKVNEGDKNVLCEYCGSEYILSSKIGIQRYFARPAKGITDYFKERNIKIIESRIIFIPILKVKTEIFGWVYGYRKGKKITYQEKDEKGRLRTYTVTIDEQWLKKHVNTYRENLFPQVRKMKLGIEKVDLNDIELLPYDDEAMHKIGSVMDLSTGIEKMKDNALKNIIKRFLAQFTGYDELKYDLECVLPYFSVIYYPVFTARTNIGYFVIDGVKNRVIYKEEKMTGEKRIRIRNYYIPIFTMVISIFSFMNPFLGFIVFLGLLIFLLYSYGD